MDNEIDPARRRLMRRDVAAEYITDTWGFSCSRQWLAKLAVVGGGPAFRKAGRTPIYARSDLDAWARSRIGELQTSASCFVASGKHDAVDTARDGE